MRLGHLPHTSSRSSMMATMESPQGNTDLGGNEQNLHFSDSPKEGRRVPPPPIVAQFYCVIRMRDVVVFSVLPLLSRVAFGGGGVF